MSTFEETQRSLLKHEQYRNTCCLGGVVVVVALCAADVIIVFVVVDGHLLTPRVGPRPWNTLILILGQLPKIGIKKKKFWGFFSVRYALSTSFSIFVVTKRVTNFLPELLVMLAIILHGKINWIFIFLKSLFLAIANFRHWNLLVTFPGLRAWTWAKNTWTCFSGSSANHRTGVAFRSSSQARFFLTSTCS